MLRSHKRYMRVDPPTAADGTTGCNLCIIGILSRPEIGPVTAAQMGLAELIKA